MAGKAERLRDFSTRVKSSPVQHVPTAKEWEQLLDEAGFTADDVELLSRQVKGHQNRARQAAEAGDEETLAFEALQGLLLAPGDRDFAKEVAALTAKTAPSVEGIADLRVRLKAVGTKVSGKPRQVKILVFLAAGLLITVATVVTLLVWQPWSSPDAPLVPAPVEAINRDLPFSLETRGVKTKLELQRSRISVYAEAAVVEVSAQIAIPDDKITVWEGNLLALDADGKTLASRPFVFLSARDAPLQPGEVVEFFQQMNAQDWKDRVVSLVFQTVEIKAFPAIPLERVVLKIAGLERLPKGYQVQVARLQSEWKDRFATKVNDSKLEIRNLGLKALKALTLRLEWTAANGEVLKVQVLKPISENRSELPSGGILTWNNQAVFESEIFSWPTDSPPELIVRLESWK